MATDVGELPRNVTRRKFLRASGGIVGGSWLAPQLPGLVALAEAAAAAHDAGAAKVWRNPVQPETVGAHLLGTCRMGDDTERSVVDRFHRSHEVPNLFICDGSSMGTSGRGQPTMTIMALAFRAAQHIAEFARQGEI